MKEFITSAKRNGEKRETLEFSHDGRTITSKKPSETQIALLMASVSGHKDEAESIAGIIDFFVNILGEIDGRYFYLRLLDGDDDFELEDLQDIMYWLIEEWSNRPSRPSSDSTSSPETSGVASTATADAVGSSSSTSTSLQPAT